MSGGLIFDEESLLNNNIFKYETRLHSQVNKFTENGAILTTYYQIREDATTVDRGLQDIEKLFGKKSPLRFNQIINFPVYGFGQLNPSNSDDIGIEDINVEGECIILPSTIVPNPNDFFIINHLKMHGIFQVVEVSYDSMKVDGNYKIRYRLHSTEEESLNNLKEQTVARYHTDLNAIGTNINPVIQEDDFIRRRQIQQMMNQMIQSYHSLFYNDRHNCFLYYDQESGERWFDSCGNEFMATHSLMNASNTTKVVILHEKIRDQHKSFYYNNSIYKWIELGSPIHLLQKFHFQLLDSEGYHDSSFARWSDNDIKVIQPWAVYQVGIHNQEFSYFDDDQLNGFGNPKLEPTSEYEKLIYKFINKGQNLSIGDISLYTADALLSSIKHQDVFLYTPIIVYIIRKVLSMN